MGLLTLRCHGSACPGVWWVAMRRRQTPSSNSVPSMQVSSAFPQGCPCVVQCAWGPPPGQLRFSLDVGMAVSPLASSEAWRGACQDFALFKSHRVNQESLVLTKASFIPLCIHKMGCCLVVGLDTVRMTLPFSTFAKGKGSQPLDKFAEGCRQGVQFSAVSLPPALGTDVKAHAGPLSTLGSYLLLLQSCAFCEGT